MINACDFGAIGDGQTNNTEAFKTAITKCSTIKNEILIIPNGKYLTGPLYLKNNVKIHLEDNAILLFGDNFDDYLPVKSRWEGMECYGYSPCLYGENLQNVSITGSGIIDGQGQRWWNEFKTRKANHRTEPISARDKEFVKLNKNIDLTDCGGGGINSFFFRPPLIQIKNCSDVLLDGFTTRNSPFWNTHILYSTNIKINNVTFQNPNDGCNGDGLDIDSSNNIEISNCIFDVNDDCLCLKSGIGQDGIRVNKPCENITVKNCKMMRGHGGVVMGSETAGDIRNIVISDCVFNGTDRGIRIKSRRGRAGTVENLTFSNITMNGVGCPIVMNLFYECGAKPQEIEYLSDRNPHPITETTPRIRNIKIQNITANKIQTAAAVFLGLPESPIENILMENIKITVDKNGKPGRPAMAFGMKETCGEGIIADFIKNPVQRNIQIIRD